MTKQETVSREGGGGAGDAKFGFAKTFSNQLFSRERVLYHQFSIKITLKIFKVKKIMSISMTIFVVFVFYLIC